jgi:hypothetical protein
MTRILTPEVHAYLTAAVVVGGAGGVAIASHIHVRWLDRFGCPAVVVHAAVLTVLAGAGVAVFGLHALSHDGWPGLAVGAVVGLPGGFVVASADVWLARRLTRSRAGTGGPTPHRSAAAGPARAATTSRMRASTVARDLAGGVDYKTSPSTWTPTARDSAVPTQLSWLLIAAVAEECVFRGVLGTAATGISWIPGRVAGLAAVMATFCLSHLYFGWPQVAAKVPLAVLATLLALVTGGVTGAVVMHAVVNTRVWWSARHQVREAGTAAPRADADAVSYRRAGRATQRARP